MATLPHAALSGDDLKAWVALGQQSIADFDPGLWSAMARINAVPEALIASESFSEHFLKLQQLFGALCDAEEAGMSATTMPRDKLQRHSDAHLDVLDTFNQVYFHAMKGDALTAQQVHEQLVAEVFQHLIDFHINYDY